MTDLNEKDLIRKAKQGDMLAFEELILKHEKIVYNLALRMMNHSEDAQDIAQEVFLKAYRSLANFDERAAFSTWLYRITHNTCIDEMRKRKGKQSYSLEEELENLLLFDIGMKGIDPIYLPDVAAVMLTDNRNETYAKLDGADGIVLMEKSAKADAKMRMFNADGTEGTVAGNALRCVCKYLYETGRAAYLAQNK